MNRAEEIAEVLRDSIAERWTLANVRRAHEARVEAMLAYIHSHGPRTDAGAYAHATLEAAEQRRSIVLAEIEHEQASFGYVRAPVADREVDQP